MIKIIARNVLRNSGELWGLVGWRDNNTKKQFDKTCEEILLARRLPFWQLGLFSSPNGTQ
jgi:hypothetical protein